MRCVCVTNSPRAPRRLHVLHLARSRLSRWGRAAQLRVSCLMARGRERAASDRRTAAWNPRGGAQQCEYLATPAHPVLNTVVCIRACGWGWGMELRAGRRGAMVWSCVAQLRMSIVLGCKAVSRELHRIGVWNRQREGRQGGMGGSRQAAGRGVGLELGSLRGHAPQARMSLLEDASLTCVM